MKMQILSNSTIRSAAILTTSYVASSTVDVGNCNELVLFVDFTKGSLTTAELKFQFSPLNNPTNTQATPSSDTGWYDYPISNTAVGTTSADEFLAPLRVYVQQLDATCAKAFPLPAKARKFRVLAKGTGTVTSSSMTIACITGVM